MLHILEKALLRYLESHPDVIEKLIEKLIATLLEDLAKLGAK